MIRIRVLVFSAILLTYFSAPSLCAELPILIIAGQSNAVGHHTDIVRTGSDALPAALRQPQMQVLYAGVQASPVSWTPLVVPTETQVLASEGGFGPELTAGKTISDAQGGRRYGIVKFAVSGTSLFEDWNPAGNPIPNERDLYPEMLHRVEDALVALPAQHSGVTGKVVGFVWMQGESDAIEGRTADQYEADLISLIASVRSDFRDSQLPFIYGLVGDLPGFASADACESIRQAQRNVDVQIGNTQLIDPRAFSKVKDQVHFNNQGELDLGIAFGRAFLKATSIESHGD